MKAGSSVSSQWYKQENDRLRELCKQQEEVWGQLQARELRGGCLVLECPAGERGSGTGKDAEKIKAGIRPYENNSSEQVYRSCQP